MESKSIVCLANSIKHGNNCVAGIELVDEVPTNWIRPIGADVGHGVSPGERMLKHDREPRPLDVLRIGVSGPAPWGHQGENWALAPYERWKKTGTWAFEDLDDLVDTPSELWEHVETSTVGIKDRVPEELLAPFGESIYLIRPDEAQVRVVRNSFSGDIEVRAEFGYADEFHLVKISDPLYKDWYVSRGIGDYELHEPYLTLSLTEPWSARPGPKYAYIVAAAVLEPDGPPGSTQ